MGSSNLPGSKWTWGRVLGSGAFSYVVSASYIDHKGQIQEVAVKRARIEDSSTLKKEFRILTALSDCPEIIDCYSDTTTVEEQGTFYNLLLQYAPLGTLQDLIDSYGKTGLPDKQVRACTRMILKGLSQMHERSYVHCDLKPENILVFPSSSGIETSYQLKLADFGLSKDPEEQILPERWRGTFRGTPNFMSPESVELGEIGPELDVWSLGCTVVIMATGSCPWSGFKWLESEHLLDLITCEDPAIPENMNKEGKGFLRKCFERDPMKRWSVRELLTHPYVSLPILEKRSGHTDLISMM